MKKIIFVIALFALFSASQVNAETSIVCVNPDHAIWSADSSTIVGCIPDVNWKESIAKQNIDLNNKNDFVKIVRGQSILTTFGYKDTCPTWFPMDCVIKKNLFVKFF